MNIGVFDSGVGGLTVAQPLYQSGCFNKIYYYGDTARVPYGSKDLNTIIRYSLEAVEYFNSLKIDILVVACNTVSVMAIEEMKKFSKVPVLGVVEPGVRSLVIDENIHINDEILLVGTKSTVSSGVYQEKILEAGFKNVKAIATPLFVPLVEEGVLDGPIMDEVLNHYFKNISKPSYILLGCTHYPFMKNAIAKYFEGSKTVHSGEAVLQWLNEFFEISNNNFITDVSFFSTDNIDHLKSFASSLGFKVC